MSSWEYWYADRQRPIEPEIPVIEKLLKKGGRVLDYGCGTGRHTLYLASRGFDVYGFDLSSSAISRARAALRRAGLHADLRVWDMTQPLPYRSSFFDCIISAMVMHHARFDTIIEEAMEIDKVLALGGFLFLQVESRAEVMRWLTQQPEAHTLIEPGTVVPLKPPEKGIPHHGFTKRELKKLFPNYRFLRLHRATRHYGGLCLVAQKSVRRA